MNTHAHYHTHVNTHFCDCGRAHIAAHTHVHRYNPSSTQVSSKTIPVAMTVPRSASPVAKRTRSKQQRATWENTPWAVDDKDIADLLDFLRKSDDPWERSLIPAVEKDAIDRQAKRAKKAAI